MNHMKNTILFFTVIASVFSSFAGNKITYTLNYNQNSDKVNIVIEFDPVEAGTAKLVIPRSAPGNYALTNYLAFVDEVVGYTAAGKELMGSVGDGSYFMFDHSDEFLKKVSYTVDIKQMETDLLYASDTSKSRKDYLGLLGYSVFGYIEGLENEAIDLKIHTDSSWRIFSTLQPSIHTRKGFNSYQAENFALLADAQYLLGKAFQVIRVKKAPIPLFVAVYSETPVNTDVIGKMGLLALQGLAGYFGYIPMPHYTLLYEFLNPISERHDYGFSMEHLNSMTSSNNTSSPIVNGNPDTRLGSIIHHIGHCWVPLRSYGEGYRPFSWQVAPLIETIWLNEGFTWYVSYYKILKNEDILEWFKRNMKQAPDYINNKSLRELSLLGSTQYAKDFRIGKNLFSRGALMAYDLDEYIQQQTNGKKSFKDAILGLLNWTKVNQRAFKYHEIEPIISKATGVDLSHIWDKWQQPLKD